MKFSPSLHYLMLIRSLPCDQSSETLWLPFHQSLLIHVRRGLNVPGVHHTSAPTPLLSRGLDVGESDGTERTEFRCVVPITSEPGQTKLIVIGMDRIFKAAKSTSSPLLLAHLAKRESIRPISVIWIIIVFVISFLNVCVFSSFGLCSN